MYIKREIEDKVEQWLDAPEILAIRGPRQCGKTTLLKKVQEKLISNGVPANHIFSIDFDEDIARLNFEKDPKAFINSYLGEGKRYFLLDEVQGVDNVGKKLKLIFDSFPNTKIIITGSSSFELTNLGKYLVGRVIFFDMLPFSFLEFLRTKGERYEQIHKAIHIDIKKPSLKKSPFIEELNTFLHEYLTFGAYPRVVLEPDKEKKKELLKNMFVTYVEKDVVARFGNKYRDSAVKLLKTVAITLGGVVNYSTLAESAGLAHKEVKELLPLLQDSFVIYIVRPFFTNAINELRKNPKVYFVDYGTCNYLTGDLDAPTFDALYENYVHNELQRSATIKYWRTTAKTEVDFIVENKEVIPVEVKTTPKITRSFRSFIAHYKPLIAIIATLKNMEEKEIDECKTYIVPFVSL